MEKPQVLIIENEKNLSQFEELLKQAKEKWDIIYVNNPQSAIHILQNMNISVVVCGIEVPELDALAFTNFIANRFEDIEVILNGALAESCAISRQQFVGSRAFDFIGTPEKVNELPESIEVAIAAQQLRRDTGRFPRF